MCKGLILSLIILFSLSAARAEFYGTLNANGGIGTYMANIADDETGHSYNGDAVETHTGILKVRVQDNFQLYEGEAVPDEVGIYHFNLRDPESGNVMEGTLEILMGY